MAHGPWALEPHSARGICCGRRCAHKGASCIVRHAPSFGRAPCDSPHEPVMAVDHSDESERMKAREAICPRSSLGSLSLPSPRTDSAQGPRSSFAARGEVTPPVRRVAFPPSSDHFATRGRQLRGVPRGVAVARSRGKGEGGRGRGRGRGEGKGLGEAMGERRSGDFTRGLMSSSPEGVALTRGSTPSSTPH
jgi:hypothetical protein